MPKELEQALRKAANRHRGWSKEKKNAYIYGTMMNRGWRPNKGK